MKPTHIFIPFILLASCGSNEKPEAKKLLDKKPMQVHLTESQIKNGEIISGTASYLQLTSTLNVTGTLDVPPQNLVSISCPLGGYVRKMDLLQGTAVKKGEVIAILEHPDYIEIQKNYLDIIERLNLARKEAERQQALAAGQAGTEKFRQQAETSLNQMIIEEKALSEKLNLIGIDARNLKPSNISSKISLRSPVKGFVKTINTNIGKYAAPNDVLIEIIDTEHLHVELSVFEKDINKLQTGQKIRFTLPGRDETERTAHVYLIGKALNTDRTIHVHGHLDKEDPELIPGLFVNARIETGKDSSWSVQESAIVNHEGKPGIFLDLGKGDYKYIPIKAGLPDNGWVAFEAKDIELSESLKIVVKGANSLMGILTGGEGEE